MIALAFWHTFQLLHVYFESHNGHKNDMFSVPTHKGTSTERQHLGASWNQGAGFSVALFTGLLFRRNKALFDPPFYFH